MLIPTWFLFIGHQHRENQRSNAITKKQKKPRALNYGPNWVTMRSMDSCCNEMEDCGHMECHFLWSGRKKSNLLFFYQARTWMSQRSSMIMLTRHLKTGKAISGYRLTME